MNKLIFITGLASGGKTTTIKAFLKLFGKNKTGSSIKVNNKSYQVRDYSNCDVGWDNFMTRVKKYCIDKNLIYPLCIDINNKESNYADFNQIIDFLNSLNTNHDLYFFIIKNGSRNRHLEEQHINVIKQQYGLGKIKIIDNTSADNSDNLKNFIESI